MLINCRGETEEVLFRHSFRMHVCLCIRRQHSSIELRLHDKTGFLSCTSSSTPAVLVLSYALHLSCTVCRCCALRISQTPFTRYSRLSNWLNYRWNNRLHHRNKHPTGCPVAKSPATINPIIPSNNTSIIHLKSHSKCIANGHSYKADRICQ